MTADCQHCGYDNPANFTTCGFCNHRRDWYPITPGELMPTTVTVDQLIAEYAAPIADLVGLAADDYEATAGGLADLLLNASDHLHSMDQVGEWLKEAAADLGAIDRLGGADKKTQRLLKRVNGLLYEAKSDLELC